MNLTVDEIVAYTGGIFHPGTRSNRLDAGGPVETDTRRDLEGAWFLAIVGERFDGHAFAAKAEEKGALGGIFSREPGPGWTGPWVEVSDTTKALQDLSCRVRDLLPNVVGLTGSSGKTTTRTLIACALQQLGTVHQTKGNLNNHFGVPMTLLACPPDADAVVVEMGTSGPGEIQLLADLVRPDARLVVNVGPAHLEELGGIEGVAYEKGALLRTARDGDIVALNADDPHLAPLQVPGRVIRWGRSPTADIRLVQVVVDDEAWQTHAEFATPVGTVHATIPAPGEHIALDAAGALAIAWGLGLDLPRAAADLRHYEAVGMRLKVEMVSGVRVINDAYNANPDSMKASLTMLSQAKGRRVAVLGDMLELGPREAAWHDDVARHAHALGLDRISLVGPRMSVAAGELKVARHPDAESAADALVAWLRPGDTVLLKGSRGARVERVLQSLQASLSPHTDAQGGT